MMLARTADNLFWLARYMERADFIARTIEATLRLEYLPRSGVDDPHAEWEGALNAAGAYEAFVEDRGAIDEASAIDYLTFDRDNPSSICNCLENARANGRAVRTALTVETWTAINDAWLELKRFEATRRAAKDLNLEGADPLPRLRQEGFARLRRLVLPHHAAQRRLLVQSAGPVHRTRRQHGAAARRQIPSAASFDRERSAARSTISNGSPYCAPCRRRQRIIGSIATGSNLG